MATTRSLVETDNLSAFGEKVSFDYGKKTVHWVKQYNQGDNEVPTYCGLIVSTWHDNLKHDATSQEVDLTCPKCMKHAIQHLRSSLDRIASESSDELAKVWNAKKRVSKLKTALKSEQTIA